jgi:hypothetical protein
VEEWRCHFVKEWPVTRGMLLRSIIWGEVVSWELRGLRGLDGGCDLEERGGEMYLEG